MERPTISYFKMSQAESIKGEFQEFDAPDKDRALKDISSTLITATPWRRSGRVGAGNPFAARV